MAFQPIIPEEVIDFKVYIPLLTDWFWREMSKLYEADLSPATESPGVLMGCPLWGEDYIDRFFFFCLPSIKSQKNWEALKGRTRIVFFTDGAGFPRLFQCADALEKHGVKANVIVIPTEIMAHVGKSPLNKYWLLGTCQNLLLQWCKRSGMGFHALHPDHLHSQEYFPNMLRLSETHDCIAQTSISADIGTCLPELEQYRMMDGSLTIPDVEVGDMGLRHIHKQASGNLMNGRNLSTELPDSHFVFWKGRDKLHIFCCHMNAVWMSPEVCASVPIRLYNALDTELPAFMSLPDGRACNIAIPEAHDGMTFIELSDDSKIHATHRVSFIDFALRCWTTVHWHEGHMPFFRLVNEVPIKEQADYAEVAEIKAQHTSIIEGLLKIKAPLQVEYEKKMAEHKAAKEATKVPEKPPKSGRALKRMQAKQNGAVHAHA